MTIPVNLASTLTVSQDQVSADLSADESGAVVILGLKDGMYFELDAVGARIWHLIQQPRSMQSLRDTLIEEYHVGITRCEIDLMKFASELVDRGLAVVVDEPTP